MDRSKDEGALDLDSSNGIESVLDDLDFQGTQDEKYHRLSSSTSRGGEGRTKLNKYSVKCALLGSLNSILLGYDIGIMSGAALYVKDDFRLDQFHVELLVGSLNLVSLIGAGCSGRVADAVGRRWTMVAAALFFLLGSLVMGFAVNYGFLLGGRLLAGIGVGIALMVAPVYNAEVSPANSRGSLVSLPEIFINVGIVLGYICSYIFSGAPENINWRFMLGLGAVPAVLMIGGALLMPESPRWLVMQNRLHEAQTVLLRTSEDEVEADLRLAEILAATGQTIGAEERSGKYREAGTVGRSSDEQIKRKGEGVWRELLRPTPAVRRMLVLALGIQFFQQATGIDATVYYSPAVFSGAGLTGKAASIGATIAVGVCKTLFILVATVWLDKVGRRPLLLSSIIGMTVSLALLAVGFQTIGVTRASKHVLPNGLAAAPLVDPHEPRLAPALAIVAICSYVSFFSVGMGPINWVITSEIFPQRLRAQAMGLGIVVNRVASATVALTFLSLNDTITLAGTFCVFAAMGLLGSIFIYLFLPETKGKTLEDIAKLFDREGDARNAVLLELGSRAAT